MILIHTALLCEAQSFIEHYKLKKIQSFPKIYANDTIIACISGIGSENTRKSLNYIFSNFSISSAFNIGIVGCNDKNIKIGEVFCTNHKLQDIKYLPLITSNSVVTDSTILEPTLYDMEGEYFHQTCTLYLEEKEIYIFKIVSDHLSSKLLQKDLVKNMIAKQKSLHQFIKLHSKKDQNC